MFGKAAEYHTGCQKAERTQSLSSFPALAAGALTARTPISYLKEMTWRGPSGSRNSVLTHRNIPCNKQACLLKESHSLASIYKQAFLCKNQKGFLFFIYTGKQGITSCYLILRKEKRKKLTFVDVSFNNSYCFVNNLNCSIFVFLLGAQCYDKFGDSYMIFYSNLENKLVFSYNLIYFPPRLLSSLYYLARKYTLICLVLSLHGRGFPKRWEGGENKR